MFALDMSWKCRVIRKTSSQVFRWVISKTDYAQNELRLVMRITRRRVLSQARLRNEFTEARERIGVCLITSVTPLPG